MIKDKENLIKKSIQSGSILLMGVFLCHAGFSYQTASIPAVTQTEAETKAEISAETSMTELLESELSAQIQQKITEYPQTPSTEETASTYDLRLASVSGLLPLYLKTTLAEPMQWDDFTEKLNSMISSYSSTWSLYLKDLSTGNTLSINERPQEAASLIKLYIMGAVYDRIEQGKLEETTQVQNLLDEMITVSDNEASNELVRYLSDSHDHREGMERVNEWVEENGFANTLQVNGLEDSNLWYSDGSVNQTSTKDCAALMEKIYNRELVSHLASLKMENLLLAQKVTYKIPDGMPGDVTIANKTGEVSDTENDSAIIYSSTGDYILCIMSTDLSNTGDAVDRIHNLSSVVYTYFDQAPSIMENSLVSSSYKIVSIYENGSLITDYAEKASTQSSTPITD